jgi:hypothetical protein
MAWAFMMVLVICMTTFFIVVKIVDAKTNQHCELIAVPVQQESE